MAHRKSDTDRRWNEYFTLSQLRKGEHVGGREEVCGGGGSAGTVPLSPFPPAPLWVACREARVRGSYFST